MVYRVIRSLFCFVYRIVCPMENVAAFVGCRERSRWPLTSINCEWRNPPQNTIPQHTDRVTHHSP